ncbi:MAG: LytTR family DNA-binding domain-containing protein [Cyclobacteriaceae bacterium]
MIKVLCVDDEPRALKALRILIERHCPDIEIIGETYNIADAYKLILELSPQLIFLDINMPGGSGLELLERIKDLSLDVIFTTAHHEYAIAALRLAALDFLLKPIDSKELQDAVARFAGKKVKYDYSLVSEILKGVKLKRIAVNTQLGVQILGVADIMYLKSDKNYSTFHLLGRQIIASRPLGEFERLLGSHGFVRIHRSTLVNCEHIQEYRKGREPRVILENGTELEVARNRKDELMSNLIRLS